MIHSLGAAKARKVIKQFSKTKILVLGDMMLDEYIWGKVDRISPEAPVPVVKVVSQSRMPGGAANVIANLYALGVGVVACSIIGKDPRGYMLRGLLQKDGIATEGIFLDTFRPTIGKTRIIAHNQQVVRVDDELLKPYTESHLAKVLRYVKRNISTIDAIIIEDYGKGFVTQDLLDNIKDIAFRRGIPITLDPKKGRNLDFSDINIITPNRAEAYAAIGEYAQDTSVEQVGRQLLSTVWKAGAILITLGEDGMLFLERDKKAIFKIPTVAKDVYDVSGAGDTVIATYTAAVVSGATPQQAAVLANCAAGIVVGKLGTASVTGKELLDSINRLEKKRR